MRTDKQLILMIEKIRRRNNTCWMDLVRLAFEVDRKKAKRIIAKIVNYDKQVTACAEKLSQNK